MRPSTGPRSPLLFALLALSLAGCAGPTTDGGEHALSGTFTEEATQEQMEQFVDHVENRGGQAVLLESFPVQFRATELTEPACQEVRSFAQSQAYVAQVGGCQAAS